MADEVPQVAFDSLLGEHVLTGVDMSVERVKQWGEHFKDANVCTFRLDGVIYTAIEDPDDGYRSSMDKFFVGGAITNEFAPVKVIGTVRTKGEYSQVDDVLVFTDAVTGKTVLEVGTENTDDYYPSFVASFHPENMAINAQP